jgi:hypothetical protein
MRTLASVVDVPATGPESVLTGSGIAARETIAIRVPRAARVRLRFIEMLLGNFTYYFFSSAGTIWGFRIRGAPNTGRAGIHRIRSWYVAVPSTCRETPSRPVGSNHPEFGDTARNLVITTAHSASGDIRQ